jgi:hypothetical protein
MLILPLMMQEFLGGMKASFVDAAAFGLLVTEGDDIWRFCCK